MKREGLVLKTGYVNPEGKPRSTHFVSLTTSSRGMIIRTDVRSRARLSTEVTRNSTMITSRIVSGSIVDVDSALRALGRVTRAFERGKWEREIWVKDENKHARLKSRKSQRRVRKTVVWLENQQLSFVFERGDFLRFG